MEEHCCPEEQGCNVSGPVAKELAGLNSKPRISAVPAAIAFWAAPGRTVNGTPKIPVLRFHTTGDHAVPPQIMDGALTARGPGLGLDWDEQAVAKYAV